MKNDITTKIERAEANLERKLEWISRHDTRIAFVAGITITMLGVLAQVSASISKWNLNLYIVFGAAASLLATSLILIYCSQYPKTESQNSSLIFFGTISTWKVDEFKKRFKEVSDEDYLDDVLCQIHINAVILGKKFRYLKSSLLVMAVAIIPWLLALYLSRFYLKVGP